MSDPSHMERENDAHIRDLSAKVDALKSVRKTFFILLYI